MKIKTSPLLWLRDFLWYLFVIFELFYSIFPIIADSNSSSMTKTFMMSSETHASISNPNWFSFLLVMLITIALHYVIFTTNLLRTPCLKFKTLHIWFFFLRMKLFVKEYMRIKCITEFIRVFSCLLFHVIVHFILGYSFYCECFKVLFLLK